MKNYLRKLTFVIFLLSVSKLASAQISFGPRLGLNFPTVAGVNNNAGFKTGFHIGGYARINFTEAISFQPELLYSTKGCTYVNGGGGLSLGYLDIPLLFNFGKKFHFQAGAQPSILLSANSKFGSGAPKTDVKSSLNGFDIAPVLGFGFHFQNGFNFGLRFSYGVSDIFKDNPGDAQHNFNTQLTFGYSFGGK
ncbi:porin family protein [Sporocytophaga myxococcoides]|uniref:porin family protein n=1 Tax=Sporocytophaga myxococcoides TaxID=153721 RepID=UPI00040F1EB8|nr:porin family protein [Sporocytophaga myxococcoides]